MMFRVHHEFREAVLRRYVVSPARFLREFPASSQRWKVEVDGSVLLTDLLFQSDLSDVSADMNFILLDLLIAHHYALHIELVLVHLS